MLLSKQFSDDIIGKLLIETKPVKIKKVDKDNIIKSIMENNDTPFVLESYSGNIDIMKIGNTMCFEFSGKYHELADYIIETCDNLGYKIVGDIDNENIRIKVIR